MNHLESVLSSKNQWWKYLIMFAGVFIGSSVIGIIPFVAFKASVLQTNALLVEQTVNPVKDLFILLAVSAIFIVILKRKYKWNFSILTKKLSLRYYNFE